MVGFGIVLVQRPADDRRHTIFHLLRQTDPQIDIERAGDLIGQELPRRATVGAPDQLAGQPTEGHRVITVARPDRPVGFRVGQHRRDGLPVERIGQCDRSVGGDQPALMAEQLGHGRVALAVRGELRPIGRDLGVVVDQAALRAHRDRDGDDPFRRAEHQLQRRVVVRTVARRRRTHRPRCRRRADRGDTPRLTRRRPRRARSSSRTPLERAPSPVRRNRQQSMCAMALTVPDVSCRRRSPSAFRSGVPRRARPD